ncbi:MAG TPA: metallophosphoesterase [Thermodesulfobacteriota bacterium]|nr:metallophosphoesterase [Thermodesulfobacteriota bacterium]
MKKFANYFKKEIWADPVGNSRRTSNAARVILGPSPAARQRSMSSHGAKTLLPAVLVFLLSFPSFAGSIRDVSQNIERINSVEPPFHFALIGDNRDGEKVYTQLIGSALARKPHFFIHLGDMIPYSSENEWHAFFEMSKPIDVPFFPVVGNHDVSPPMLGEKLYRKQFLLPEGKTHYAFRAGGVLFVVLDSEEGRARIIGEQLSWLENILSSSKETFKLVFLHRPLFLPLDSLKRGHAMDRHPVERDALHHLFLKTNVKAVFEADDHRFNRMEKDHILYVITGGGGAPLASLKERGGFFHYVWVSVRNGGMEGEAVDLEGQIRDRFRIE